MPAENRFTAPSGVRIPAAETIQETTIPVQEILAMIRLEAEMNPAEMTLAVEMAAQELTISQTENKKLK